MDNNTSYEVFSDEPFQVHLYNGNNNSHSNAMSDEPFQVHLYNGNNNSHSNAMGKWLLDVDGIDITLSTCYQ